VVIHCSGGFPTEREQGIAVGDGVGSRTKANLDFFVLDGTHDDDPDMFLFSGDAFDDSHGASPR
jgi:hypothetical protein